jgi:aromatic ring-opening dioxygenase catalytic subunit (LigB family)
MDMASLVVGIGTSHSPQLSIPAQKWQLLRTKDETDPRLDFAALVKRAKKGLDDELYPAVWKQRDEACQRAIAALGQRLRDARPDVVVVVGDDQQEQFHDDNMPTFAVFNGGSLPMTHREGRTSPWQQAETEGWAQTKAEYRSVAELGTHLVRSLVDAEFDVARADRLRPEVGVGHAFAFLYRRIWPGGDVPIVPVMLNTLYPPNQPTPRRCYALGQALRTALESWDSGTRVAVMASGGLSHVVIDEELDRGALEAMAAKDADRLAAIPRAKLKGGTSEILSWVTVAGVMSREPMTIVDYVPTYRSPAGTGCGMAFAYWQ